jgi:hypothetical protein
VNQKIVYLLGKLSLAFIRVSAGNRRRLLPNTLFANHKEEPNHQHENLTRKSTKLSIFRWSSVMDPIKRHLIEPLRVRRNDRSKSGQGGMARAEYDTPNLRKSQGARSRVAMVHSSGAPLPSIKPSDIHSNNPSSFSNSPLRSLNGREASIESNKLSRGFDYDVPVQSDPPVSHPRPASVSPADELPSTIQDINVCFISFSSVCSLFSDP